MKFYVLVLAAFISGCVVVPVTTVIDNTNILRGSGRGIAFGTATFTTENITGLTCKGNFQATMTSTGNMSCNDGKTGKFIVNGGSGGYWIGEGKMSDGKPFKIYVNIFPDTLTK